MKKLCPNKKPASSPTGYELLDILWADRSPLAPNYLEELPRNVDPSWGAAKGLLEFWVLELAIDHATRELTRTRLTSTVRLLRERRLHRLLVGSQKCTSLICAALAGAAHAAHGKATKTQVLMLVLEGFKTLVIAHGQKLADLTRRYARPLTSTIFRSTALRRTAMVLDVRDVQGLHAHGFQRL